MDLLEYEAKLLLKKYSIPTPESSLITSTTDVLSFPVVLKSQVPVGGRGLAGGIKIVESSDNATQTVKDLLSLSIKGHLPKVLLGEEKLIIKKELYLSLYIDRDTEHITLMAHTNGGVEIEAQEKDSFYTKELDVETSFETLGETLAEYYDIPKQSFVLGDIAKNLFDCLIQNDATLIEINPLILTSDSKLIAGDCKMTLDDAAKFRHPEWQDFEHQSVDANFVILDTKGNIATIANGAGLAMATVDAVKEAGFTPANFLDIGGGASEASVLTAFEQIVLQKSVRGIVINIFAGITRCDEVAKAIIGAKDKIADLPPLFIRLTGTNATIAAELLAAESIELFDSLDSCLAALEESI